MQCSPCNMYVCSCVHTYVGLWKAVACTYVWTYVHTYICTVGIKKKFTFRNSNTHRFTQWLPSVLRKNHSPYCVAYYRSFRAAQFSIANESRALILDARIFYYVGQWQNGRSGDLGDIVHWVFLLSFKVFESKENCNRCWLWLFERHLRNP